MGDANRDTATEDPGEDRQVSAKPANWFERIVVVVTLLTAVGVMIAAGLGLFQSAAITSFFVGVAAATLTFHFLGGVGDAGWNTPGVKLGGAAAVLVAVGGISFTQLKPELERRDALQEKGRSMSETSPTRTSASPRSSFSPATMSPGTMSSIGSRSFGSPTPNHRSASR